MSARVTIIAAMAEDRVIGVDNTIPWHISADFKHFKSVTMGKPMVMGRKTFESLPGVLPGRTHIVVSRRGFAADGVKSAASLEEGIALAQAENSEEVFIIGGAQIYTQALQQNLVNRMVLTEIHERYDGDAFFPEFNKGEWQETTRERHDKDGKKPAFSFITYDKK